MLFEEPALPSSPSTSYRVLARAYRPQSFHELIGQELLVSSLTQAIARERLPHAFIFTGIRGVGKTSTARILARCLNCVTGPTITPCGTCNSCRAIQEDRHLDVIEIDAASRTGVDDMREVIEAGRYRAVMGRYKIFIIDEVHMLSKSAFNALLKTLEEPPPHLIFIMATTEIEKVPSTILSRCMRCELKRVDRQTLKAHFEAVAAKEGATMSADAAELLARAADGSVRDGLSLLDQAITLARQEVTLETVQDMLGLIDRARTLEWFELIAKGAVREALLMFRAFYQQGAHCVRLVEDLLELIHTLATLKVGAAEPDEAPSYIVTERARIDALASALSLSALTEAWHVLLKGLSEVQNAPDPGLALEMLLIRLMHLKDASASGITAKEDSGSAQRAHEKELFAGAQVVSLPLAPSEGTHHWPLPMTAPISVAAEEGASALPPPSPSSPPPPSRAAGFPERKGEEERELSTFSSVVHLVRQKRELMLYEALRRDVHLVSYDVGKIVLRFLPTAPADLLRRLANFLEQETGQTWVVLGSQEQGMPTLLQQEEQALEEARDKMLANPLMKAVVDAFPGAVINIEPQHVVYK